MRFNGGNLGTGVGSLERVKKACCQHMWLNPEYQGEFLSTNRRRFVEVYSPQRYW